jgi:hypothetical protein
MHRTGTVGGMQSATAFPDAVRDAVSRGGMRGTAARSITAFRRNGTGMKGIPDAQNVWGAEGAGEEPFELSTPQGSKWAGKQASPGTPSGGCEGHLERRSPVLFAGERTEVDSGGLQAQGAASHCAKGRESQCQCRGGSRTASRGPRGGAAAAWWGEQGCGVRWSRVLAFYPCPVLSCRG